MKRKFLFAIVLALILAAFVSCGSHEHTEVVDAAVTPTCTKTGLTEGKHCSECNEVLVKQEAVVAVGHNYDKGVCTVCGEYYFSQGLPFAFNGDGTCYVTFGNKITDAEVYIPNVSPAGDTVTGIGGNAFSGNSSLTSVVIPGSVTSIGASAFSNCSSLTSVVIPGSVTSIGMRAFEKCGNLTSVYYTGDITDWLNISFAGYHANPMANGADLYLNGEKVTEIIIPNSVTSIGSNAFSGCSSLTSVVIPDSVTSIGAAAFNNCSSLTSVVIPGSVTSIGDYAFEICSSLTNVYYGGTASDWASISIIDSYNHYLMRARRYYYSETQPTKVGNYWHYVDGVPTVWENN